MTTLAAGRVTTGQLHQSALTLRGLSGDPVVAQVMEVGVRTAPRALFLHGLVGLNEHWLPVVRTVRTQLRCILLQLPLLSLRGRDCSVDGVVHLARQFVGARPDLANGIAVGSSFGGHVALRLALADGSRFSGIVLAGSSGLGDRQVRAEDFQLSRAWLEDRIGIMFHDPAVMPAADLTRARALVQGGPEARAMVRLCRSACADDLRPMLPTLTVPTSIVWGRQDRVTPPAGAAEFARLLPRSHLTWLDDCGHAPMLERPAELAAAILEAAALSGTLS